MTAPITYQDGRLVSPQIFARMEDSGAVNVTPTPRMKSLWIEGQLWERLAEISVRDAVARAYDPRAFEFHPIEYRRPAAAIQWAARRMLATDAANRLLERYTVTERS